MSSIKASNNQINRYNTKDITKNILDLKLDEEEKSEDPLDYNYKWRNARRMHSTYISTHPKLFLEE